MSSESWGESGFGPHLGALEASTGLATQNSVNVFRMNELMNKQTKDDRAVW